MNRDAILAARAEAIRRPREVSAPVDRIQVVLFRTGSERYAIRSEDVAGIHRLDNLVSVPGAPAAIRGIALLGGEIFSLVDLEILLASPARGLVDNRHAIVIGKHPRRIALLAAEVEGIDEISAGALRPWEGDPSIEGLIGEDRPLLRLAALFENTRVWEVGK